MDVSPRWILTTPNSPPSHFQSALDFEDRGGYPFKLTRPLVYYSANLRRLLRVRAGFLTDLASIPWLVQPLLPRVGRWDRAAVIHDALYATQRYSRYRCDAILREAMTADGVGWTARWAIWLGVRVGGWWAWHCDGRKLTATRLA